MLRDGFPEEEYDTLLWSRGIRDVAESLFLRYQQGDIGAALAFDVAGHGVGAPKSDASSEYVFGRVTWRVRAPRLPAWQDLLRPLHPLRHGQCQSTSGLFGVMYVGVPAAGANQLRGGRRVGQNEHDITETVDEACRALVDDVTGSSPTASTWRGGGVPRHTWCIGS